MDNPSYYAVIPANVRYSKMVSATAKLLYGEITALSSKEGHCWASNSYFAKLYDVSVKSISRWVCELEDAGFLKTEVTFGNKRKIYINSDGQKCLAVMDKNVHSDGQKCPPSNNIYNTTNNIVPTGTQAKKEKVLTPISKAESDDLIAKLDERLGADKYMDLIGAYLDRRKCVFATKEAFREAVRRHVKMAHTLKDNFTESEIDRGMDLAEKKFPEEWTLETVYKQLTK